MGTEPTPTELAQQAASIAEDVRLVLDDLDYRTGLTNALGSLATAIELLAQAYTCRSVPAPTVD